MSDNSEPNSLLSKILDRLIQLSETSSKIEAKTCQLALEQEKLSSKVSKLHQDYDRLVIDIQENRSKISTFNIVRSELEARKDKRFNWILSLLLLIISSICSYLLYLVQ